jgi:carboxylesterase
VKSRRGVTGRLWPDLIGSPVIVGAPLERGTAAVQPGGEAFRFPGTLRTAVLVIHGWSGSPYETRPLGEALADRGFPVLGLRLPGHGTDPREMHAYRRGDWLGAAREALNELIDEGHRVVIFGQSMGGLIAMTLAMEMVGRPELVGIATMGAPVWIIGPHTRALGHIRRVWPPGQPIIDIQDPTHRGTIVNYRAVHLQSVTDLLYFSGWVRRRLGQIKQPILIGQGRLDRVVLPANGKIIYDRVGSEDRTLHYYERSGHIVPLDYDAPEAFAHIADFALRVGRD